MLCIILPLAVIHGVDSRERTPDRCRPQDRQYSAAGHARNTPKPEHVVQVTLWHGVAQYGGHNVARRG